MTSPIRRRLPWYLGVFFPEDISAFFRVADASAYPRAFEFTNRMFHAWAKQGFYRTGTTDWPKKGRANRYVIFGALLTARRVVMLRSRGVGLPRIRTAHEFIKAATGHEFPFIAKPI